VEGMFGDAKRGSKGSLKYGAELAIFIFYNMICNIISYCKVLVYILISDSYCDLTKYSYKRYSL
jgi:hypothetical protein